MYSEIYGQICDEFEDILMTKLDIFPILEKDLKEAGI
jgi:hypothetical protein